MVNVFPPTGKEGETSRKHGAAVLGLIASHVYSRSAIIQMRVQIQLHRDACTNTVAHIKLLSKAKHSFSCTLVLAYCCTVLTCSCTLVFLFSCIFKLCNHFQFATLGLRGPSKVCHLVSFHLIAFENISSNKNMPIFIHKYKYKWNHLVSPASCHQARQPCTGRQSYLLSLSPDEKISIVVAPKHQILIP